MGDEENSNNKTDELPKQQNAILARIHQQAERRRKRKNTDNEEQLNSQNTKSENGEINDGIDNSCEVSPPKKKKKKDKESKLNLESSTKKKKDNKVSALDEQSFSKEKNKKNIKNNSNESREINDTESEDDDASVTQNGFSAANMEKQTHKEVGGYTVIGRVKQDKKLKVWFVS